MVSNTKNKALEVIKNAKETKREYTQQSYKCVQYSKNSIEKRRFKLKRNDTLDFMDLDTSKNINFDNEILKFIETFGNYYHLQPKGHYWDYIGYHDFADTKPQEDYTIIQDFEDFGEYNITPQYDIDDPYANLMDLINLEINLSIVAAFLTIVGYSLNDTIVIFDRYRENSQKDLKLSLIDLANLSLNQTLSRTIITSLTTLMVVTILFFIGGEAIKYFAFALIIGVIVGTYSSMFVASPFMLFFKSRIKVEEE